ncbi:MAG: efflux RND transporter permease subunit [Candidatus Omnitrophota bacterium]|jgi:Cu(I)/Ag(I) efflux system membrane protein CusA/SilA|nr:MAG: efflux RND transporter permease subunit [Candidatus Omnitrophota bacterium]
MLDSIIRYCLENKLVVTLFVIFIVVWGIMVAPFDWELSAFPRDPVPVDAIPDIGENQQIVFTEWMGRSPQDVEDQISYPLTVSLLGVPGIRTIRSYSFFGFSSIYIIFNDNIDFYWSRTRILEKLNSLPTGALPEGVQPMLGPDATALGQVFWYTLEGYDRNGNPTGGWDPQELRTVQDWHVRYSLQSAEGVSEVASVGGFVKEYQIDVDPDAMRAYNVTLEEVFNAVRMSNIDVGARTIEVNRVEYFIRGLGFIKNVEDIENSVIKVNNNVPVTLKQVAHVSLGPALRRGALDKAGAEAVGGVVVMRYGENPLKVIKYVKEKIEEISPGLPQKTLSDGTVSQVRIVPFYDRTGLIYETLGTLRSALTEEILVTIIVIIILLNHLRSSILVSGLLPLAVLMCFIAMKLFGVDANIVALSGIAIAIGTMVDMGIVICENIHRHLEEADERESKLEVIYRASTEVGGAVLTAVSTTIVSFLPVFTMIAAEGKLFKPLAFTKTFALFASIVVALTIIPPYAHFLFTGRIRMKHMRDSVYAALIIFGLTSSFIFSLWIGLLIMAFGLYHFLSAWIPNGIKNRTEWMVNGLAVIVLGLILSHHWLPLGPEKGILLNFVFVGGMVGGLLGAFHYFQLIYEPILRWCLRNKLLFLSIPTLLVLWGGLIWLGTDTIFGFLPSFIKKSSPYIAARHAFPGLGKEFMPPLDEGSYLYMPTTMPHASIGESMDVLSKLDMAINGIPEIEQVVGKIGRVDSPLDPAPVSMVETIINYKSEYILDKNGRRMRFAFDSASGEFIRDASNELIPDPNGRPFRQWREHIRTPDDIWEEITKAAELPGTTSAPKLQPIAARIVMLQSGMRAPMGVKVKGPDLPTIEKVGLEIERFLKEVPSVQADAVIADRIVGKPYLEIDIDRKAIARYGIMIRQIQDVIEIAIGGRRITTTVEGRERYPVRVRYQRELRDRIETLGAILVPSPTGAQIPLRELAEIRYVRGPQMIKSEDTFLVGYVLFDKKPGYAEVDVVEQCQRHLQEKIRDGEFDLPAGVSYAFAGSYENQVRSEKKLRVVLPLALFIIFLLLYFQFKTIPTTLLVFSGIFVAWAGGFQMLWLYSQSWFLNFELVGVNMRDLFQVQPFNLSVAVWVGFLALFGIASDDGVIMATYIGQSFERLRPKSVAEIREAIVQAGKRRIRPCLMTSATTILALIPVLTSSGRGSDVMTPMAIPSFGGMTVVMITVFVVPVLYCAVEEFKLRVTKEV